MKKIGLAECCMKTQESLKAFLKAELVERGYSPIEQDGFLYAEGDLPVMLTAHMDTVHHDNCTIICTSPDGKYWMSPQGIGGDDRCGIYAIMKIAETHKVSILFTEDEEVGCVGAKKYAKIIKENPDCGLIPKSLNYIIEIDRKNSDDAVFYDCNNEDFEKFVTAEDIGFKTATGSCSDISYVAPALGVAAVNFSSGYYNPHQISEYINLEELHETIRRIKLIIEKPSEKFEYVEGRKSKWTYTGSSSYYDYSYYRGYQYDEDEDFTDPDYNYAFEDFAYDMGVKTDEFIKELVSVTSSWYYTVKNNQTNDTSEVKPSIEDEKRFFYDKEFNLYEYDAALDIMKDCDCKITSRRFHSSQSQVQMYFAKYLSRKYYVVPREMYDLFYNYYQENAYFYEGYDCKDDVPADDDIQKKDEMEEDILKLYN